MIPLSAAIFSMIGIFCAASPHQASVIISQIIGLGLEPTASEIPCSILTVLDSRFILCQFSFVNPASDSDCLGPVVFPSSTNRSINAEYSANDIDLSRQDLITP